MPGVITMIVGPKAPQNVPEGGQLQRSAVVADSSDTAVNWMVSVGGDTITPDGLYSVRAGPAAAGTHAVTATPNGDSTKSDSGSVIRLAVSVSVSPNRAFLASGLSEPPSAHVIGAASGAVGWFSQNASKGPSAGTVSDVGLNAAPNATSSIGTLAVVATSPVESGRFARGAR